jgi:cysteine synthase
MPAPGAGTPGRQTLGLEDHVVDRAAYERTAARFREARILLPTFAELADPSKIPARVTSALAAVEPDDRHPLNLFRVHWFNGPGRADRVPVPAHLVLPPQFTGVPAKIVVAPADRFPMIRAHKVLATYGCLAPRIVTGQFDPTVHRAIWPSTGNYCRGGVAVSAIMGCHGVAVLPEGMSRERFAWLDEWVASPGDIIRTPGTESNVKEIYDKCAELALDPANVIFNQFCEFGNHLAHYLCTGTALGSVFEELRQADPGLRLRAFVSASGSAGTLGAGDYLKDSYGSAIVAAEALECPTMLANGFGEHNIQGIGDKHIPLIHNVMNTDIVTAVSDRATDQLGVLLSSPAGKRYLAGRHGVHAGTIAGFASFGLSSICNIVAAVKTAKHLGLGPQDVVMTVATDGADMYETERVRVLARDFPAGFGEPEAAETFGRWLLGAGTGHLLETTRADRERIFNLGYYTWVEQQGVPVGDFTARRGPAFWTGLRGQLARWDEMIREFNARTGVGEQL